MSMAQTDQVPGPGDPPLECDLVMKGGITSGVVYPLAVCELARVYRLRSVGGSSAGAIAAAAAACAELGRANGGFDRLATLPGQLAERVGGRSRLFTLFAPQPAMRRLFRLLTAGLGRSGAARTRNIVLAGGAAWWLFGLLGSLPGLVCLALGITGSGVAAVAAVVCGVLLALVGAGSGVLYGVYRDLGAAPEGGFGLSTGMPPAGADEPALTPWLHATFQQLAGRTVADPPVTFGDLAAAGITLRLMTTNLSRRQPMTMPWGEGGYAFDPARFRMLFPESVVAAMQAAVPPADLTSRQGWQSALSQLQAAPLLPFPAAADLPVIVAVRMSLSFPGLITAVPLHAVDWSLQVNQQAGAAARSWQAAHPNGSPSQAAAVLPAPRWQVNWFSDGGICANLPLQFFDTMLPVRPTFAIDLDSFPPDRGRSADESDNSFLPTHNNSGLLRRQRLLGTDGIGALAGFFGAIVDTARTWVDEAQLSLPGYRDRIVTVFHAADEGGMNLDMDAATVSALSRRGQGAARSLIDRFAGDQPGVLPAEGWDNHRWLRFRAFGAALSDMLTSFRLGYRSTLPGSTPFDTWVGVNAEGVPADGALPSYPLSRARRAAVNQRTSRLLATADDWSTDPADAFVDNAPKPRPAMRLVPVDELGDPRSARPATPDDAGAGPADRRGE